jgi:hypothetical protein
MGQIFTQWAAVYFGKFLEITEIALILVYYFPRYK